jgi:phage regulator Rha-like protein
MNQLLNLNNELTMSSIEIAELCNKEHKHVMRDIRIMLEQLKLDESKFGSTYFDIQNREQTCFNLDKNITLCLVAGYSAILRMKIIKRWQELENQQKPKIPQTYLEALKELVIVTEEKERLQSLNNALTHVHKTYTASEIAKECGLKSAKALNKILHEKGIQYKNNSTWLPYSKYSNLGLYDIKQGIAENGHVYYNSQFSQKGRQFILALLGII